MADEPRHAFLNGNLNTIGTVSNVVGLCSQVTLAHDMLVLLSINSYVVGKPFTCSCLNLSMESSWDSANDCRGLTLSRGPDLSISEDRRRALGETTSSSEDQK